LWKELRTEISSTMRLDASFPETSPDHPENETANADLRVDLMVLEPPTPANEKELIDLPDFHQEDHQGEGHLARRGRVDRAGRQVRFQGDKPQGLRIEDHLALLRPEIPSLPDAAREVGA
jgi:hypothetical protein